LKTKNKIKKEKGVDRERGSCIITSSLRRKEVIAQKEKSRMNKIKLDRVKRELIE
jgi:hypothetical protein